MTDGEYQQLPERCNGSATGGGCSNLSPIHSPARSLRAAVHRSGLLRQPADGEQPQPDRPRKINGGQWSGADRVQVVAALMAIDAELERLRHAGLGRR